MALRAMREASLSRSPGYLNKEIFLFSLRGFMIGYAHGAGWEADDRQGNWVGLCNGADLFPWPRTVAESLWLAAGAVEAPLW